MNANRQYGYGFINTVVAAGQTNETLVAAQTGKIIVVDWFIIATNGANNINLESNATDLAPFYYLAANGHAEMPSCHIKCAKSEALKWTTSAATNASIALEYHFEE